MAVGVNTNIFQTQTYQKKENKQTKKVRSVGFHYNWRRAMEDLPVILFIF